MLKTQQKVEKLGIREVKPCSVCGGPLKGGIFRIVTVQLAVLNPRAINAFLGTAQITGSARIAEVMAPCDDAIEILAEPDTIMRLFVCNDCQCKDWCLGEVLERESDRASREEAGEEE